MAPLGLDSLINWGGKEEKEKLLEGSGGVGSPKQLFLDSSVRKALWMGTVKGFPPQQPTMGDFPSVGTGCWSQTLSLNSCSSSWHF